MTLLFSMNLGLAWGATTPSPNQFWCALSGSSAQTGGGDIEELE